MLSFLTLSLFVIPLVEGRERGWQLMMLVATPVLVQAFRRSEIRLAKADGEPVISISALQTPGLLRGLGAIWLLHAAAAFFQTHFIYLQTALGFAALTALLPVGYSPPLAPLVTATAVIGLDMGMSALTMVRLIVERVDPPQDVLVGDMVNSRPQVSSTLAIAMLGGLCFSLLRGRSDAAAVTHGFPTTLLGICLYHLLGAGLAAGLGQRRKTCPNPV